MAMHDVDWRSLSKAELDKGLNNSAARENASQLVDSWVDISTAFKSGYPDYLDREYGPRPRNKYDFLKSCDGGPTLVLIHGGYWQMRSKDIFAMFAQGALACGINVAVVGYTLAPEATMDEIVAELHACIDSFVEQLPAMGGDAERIIVSGWSAGGHLTATTLSHPRVKAALAISGIYDLEPIRHSYLNEKLMLDEAMSLRHSPILQRGENKPLALVVGADELPLLRQQTADYALHRIRGRMPVIYEEIPGADHFTVLDSLREKNGQLTVMLKDLVARIS